MIGLEVFEGLLYDGEDELNRHVLWRIGHVEYHSDVALNAFISHGMSVMNPKIVHEYYRWPIANLLLNFFDKFNELLLIHGLPCAHVMHKPMFA